MTSIIKVDNLQNQCGANIISESSNVITIGASGDTVTLAAGASQSGFGRSGSVNWDTTPKTTGFTAVSGNGYFCDTTSAAFTVTLPAGPSAGDIVAIADYNGTALTNNITVGRNSSNINGSATNLIINTNYSAITLVYVDATSGWRSVDSSNPNDIITPQYIAATGGTIVTCGDFKIHTFTGPGTFTVTNAGNSSGANSVNYLVVAGGGASSASTTTPGGLSIYSSGGGGAGGYRTNFPSPVTTGLPVTATAYPITVGGGGTGGPLSSPYEGTSGINSVFSTITSTGGGFGGRGNGSPFPAPNGAGGPGGSGGGGGASSICSPGGTGNTPPVSPPQGNTGGAGSSGGPTGGGGGGGASSIGGNGPVITPPASPPGTGGAGGNGTANLISGSSVTYAGGGGGAGGYFVNPGTGGAGGPGGGGTGGASGGPGPDQGVAGAANTGGGAGGTQNYPCSSRGGNAGGSGIVVIRYKFQ